MCTSLIIVLVTGHPFDFSKCSRSDTLPRTNVCAIIGLTLVCYNHNVT